ncbi:MAG: glutaredoxin family protein [Woeseiaceae bacterium]|nr:glutaredoxin family protein [Woeseiaceae bacterium]
MLAIDVFSRRGCHLCEVLIEELLPIVEGRATVSVHDVDTRDEWAASYGDKVPVVALGGRVLCQYKLDVEAVHSALAAGE